MRAFVMLRPDPCYRSEAFVVGLRACGLDVIRGAPISPARGDVLCIWNRYGASDQQATAFERQGLPVLVAENGYLGRDAEGGPWYSLSRNRHNGLGTWPAGGPERWASFGVRLRPWREDGRHIVVLASRSIGVPPNAEPRGWSQQVADRLSATQSRPVLYRKHPGTDGNNEADGSPNRQSLERDLAGAWACVTWGSGAALKALVLGIPVFYGLRDWIGAAAARPVTYGIEDPFCGDRLPIFQRMSWAMWRLDEIRSGVPFRRLLE